MIGNFDLSLHWVLDHEGGYVDDPKDPGGRTNLGVTQRTLAMFLWRDVTEQEMRDLTVADVTPIYKKMYWDKVSGDTLPAGVDHAIFDFAVNAGVGTAVKRLQRIVGVEADGLLGPKTLAAVSENTPEHVIEELYKLRKVYYEGLPTFTHFGRGWSRRNKETREQALSLVG